MASSRRSFTSSGAWLRGLAACLGALQLGCSYMVYFPDKVIREFPKEPYQSLRVPVKGDGELHTWYFPAKASAPPQPVVLQFHGNAGNIGGHSKGLRFLRAKGFDVLSFDYRGYGESSEVDWPSQASTHEDALAMLRFGATLARCRRREFVPYGQSLGGAILLAAVDEALENAPPKTIVIEGSFASYSEVAASVLWRPWLLKPFTGFAYAIVSDETSPANVLPTRHDWPLVVIHSREDDVVPYSMGRHIYRLAAGRKQFWSTTGKHIRAMKSEMNRQRLVALIGSPAAITQHMPTRGQSSPAANKTGPAACAKAAMAALTTSQ